MSKTTSETISRRRTLALLGFSAILGFAGSSLVPEEAEAQTVEWIGAKAGEIDAKIAATPVKRGAKGDAQLARYDAIRLEQPPYDLSASVGRPERGPSVEYTRMPRVGASS